MSINHNADSFILHILLYSGCLSVCPNINFVSVIYLQVPPFQTRVDALKTAVIAAGADLDRLDLSNFFFSFS